jgi:hypothetical protein
MFTCGSDGVVQQLSAKPQLESFAEDLGRLLGTAENKARGWLDQRKAIVAQLAQLRDKTDSLLRELTEGGAKMVAAVRLARGTQRRRPPGTVKKTPKKRGHRFTAAQRKEQAERMRAYWANRRKAAKLTPKKTRLGTS